MPLRLHYASCLARYEFTSNIAAFRLLGGFKLRSSELLVLPPGYTAASAQSQTTPPADVYLCVAAPVSTPCDPQGGMGSNRQGRINGFVPLDLAVGGYDVSDKSLKEHSDTLMQAAYQDALQLKVRNVRYVDIMDDFIDVDVPIDWRPSVVSNVGRQSLSSSTYNHMLWTSVASTSILARLSNMSWTKTRLISLWSCAPGRLLT